MASPFAVFRKHQKVLLATLGLLAMIAFVFLGPAADYLSSRRRAIDDPVVVSWKYGDLHRSQLYNQIMLRNQVSYFMGLAYQQAVQNGATPAQRPGELATDERSVVRTMLLAKRAEEMGMVVSDATVNGFLRQITGDAVGPDQLNSIVRSLGGRGGRLSMYHVFDVLRNEILAHQLYLLAAFGIGSENVGILQETPAQRFANYEKLERTAKIEAAALDVANFVDEVPNPSEQQLREFYDLYKDQIPQPDFIQNTRLDSPTPGFKRPPRAAFHYVKANLDEFVEAAKANISDDDITAYYEENKDGLFQNTSSDNLFDDFDASEFDNELEDPDSDSGSETESIEEPADSVIDEGTVSEESSDALEDSLAGNEAEPADESQNQDGENSQPATDDNSSEAADEKDSSGEESETDEGEKENAPDVNSQVTGKPTSEGDASNPTDVNSTGDVVETETSEENESPVDESVLPDGEQDQPSPRPDVDTATSDSDTASSEEPKYQPLDEVRDDIITTLARNLARERIQASFNEIRSAIATYSRDKVVWQAKMEIWEEDKSGERPEEPTPPDMEKLVQDAGFELQSTEPMSALQLNEQTDLGKSFQFEQQPSMEFPRQIPFVNLAYGESYNLYEPAVSIDVEGNQYLAWKTASLPEEVPAFEDIQDEVVQAWKLKEAQKPALEKAQELAEKAKSGAGLQESLADEPGLKLLATEPFSWLTVGLGGLDPTLRSPPRLSEIEGIENAGPEFMKTVFGLREAEVAVVLNHPKTMVYIVKLISMDPPDEALRTFFIADNYQRYASVATMDRQDLYAAWVEDLEREANLEWNEEALDSELNNN